MGEILDLGLERLVKSFQEEKVTPDIVGKLSTTQMEYLGLTDRDGVLISTSWKIYLKYDLLNTNYLIPNNLFFY